MVVADVGALRASFCHKGVQAARRAMEQIHLHAGEPSAPANLCYYLWQAMDVCYHYAQAWQVVVECALDAHEEMLRTGRWAGWRDYLEIALTASRHIDDTQAEMTLLLYLGQMQERCGEWSSARARLEKVVALAKDPQARGRALTVLADLERQAGQLDKAQQQISLALAALEGSGDARGLSEAYRVKANLELQHGRNAEALSIYSKALEFAEECGDLSCLASIYHNLGTICAQQGESRGAALQYHRALELFRQTGDQAGEVMTLSNIGLACQADRGYWQQAVETFQQAITLSDKTGYYQGEVTALSYLVDILLKLGQIEQAAAAVERLRALHTRTNSTHGLATVEHDLGMICLARGEAQAAMIHLQRARESPELVADPEEEMAPTETDLGRAYMQLGMWEEAEAAFGRALAQWATFTEWPGELETRLDLVELYRQMGAWEKMEPALGQARLLAQKIEREDALARLGAAWGDARFAAGEVQAGCDAYAAAVRRLIGYTENDRMTQCYRHLVEQAQAHIHRLERAGRTDEAAALRASLQTKPGVG